MTQQSGFRGNLTNIIARNLHQGGFNDSPGAIRLAAASFAGQQTTADKVPITTDANGNTVAIPIRNINNVFIAQCDIDFCENSSPAGL